MLRIRVIKAVAPRVRYFLAGSALSDTEKIGQWRGASAEAAGFNTSTPINARDFEQALEGYAPDGRYLGQQRKKARRAGWDVVLSPHKSISVAALCLPSEIASEVREAYTLSTTAAIRAMEALACRCDGPRMPIPTGNLVVATFEHERSRRNDPHLHTHCIVINATFDQQHGQKWRGLEPSPFFRNNLLLDAAFQGELIRQLKLRGFPVKADAKGRALLPMPEVIIARLSSAKKAIDDAIAQAAPEVASIGERVKNPDRLRNRINDRIRPPKTPPLTPLRDSLTSAERRSLSRGLRPRRRPRPGPAPSDPALAKRIEAHYHRQTLWPASKALFRAVVTAARETIAAPLDAFLRALHFVRHPRSPANPALPQQVIAATAPTSLLLSPRSARARQLQRLHRQRAVAPPMGTLTAAAARLRAKKRAATPGPTGNIAPLPAGGGRTIPPTAQP